MKLWSTIHKCYVETVGIVSGNTILCMTEEGRWVHGHPDNLVKDRPKENVAEDMAITVGHVIDNPTLHFDGDFEITHTDYDGAVITLYDSQRDETKVPNSLLRLDVSYMVVNTEIGRLRIEVE